MTKLCKYITIGHDRYGKRIRKRFYGNSKAEVECNIRNYFAEISQLNNPSEITFGTYSQRWFDAYKSRRSEATQIMYEHVLDKLEPLDTRLLKSITRSECQQLVNEYYEQPRTATILRQTLKQIFKTAVADGIIRLNPAEQLEIPKYKAKEKHLLTDEEVKAFQNAELSDMDRMFVNIMFVFGLRPGEALALQKTDFDFDEKILRVSKSLDMTGVPKIKSTKTGVVREIPIPEFFIPQLKTFFTAFKGFYMFQRKDGGLFSKSAYVRLSKRILDAVNIQLGGDAENSKVDKISMYSIRHYRSTQLYYLCQRGLLSTKKASQLMGNSEEVFIRVYSHINEKHEQIDALYDDVVISG